jgi:hypothetical protein
MFSGEFKAILAAIASMLEAHKFRRKGAWFSKLSADGEWIMCMNVRRVPQVGPKRAVFQVVSYAGRHAEGAKLPIGSLEEAHQFKSFEHHIVRGQCEMLWTIWPSTDIGELATKVVAEIESQSLVALEGFLLSSSSQSGN